MNRPVTVLAAEESVARALRRAGMRVIEAADGVEVLEYIRNETPDAAVLDVLLPGLPALEVCRQRRSASRPATPAPDVGRDAVTGLANHDALAFRVEELFTQAASDSESLAVLTLDLDGLGAVNERFGRGAGDRLLAACARAPLPTSRISPPAHMSERR